MVTGGFFEASLKCPMIFSERVLSEPQFAVGRRHIVDAGDRCRPGYPLSNPHHLIGVSTGRFSGRASPHAHQ